MSLVYAAGGATGGLAVVGLCKLSSISTNSVKVTLSLDMLFTGDG